MEWYFVYILESELDQSWYIGYTKGIEKRLNEHNSGKTESIRKKIPYTIIYYEANLSKEDAIAREKYLKSGMGRRYLKNRMQNYFKNF